MSLFSSLANKAQSAINQSGLADKLPSSVANALGQQQQPGAGQQPGQGATGQQYAPAPGQPQGQYQPQGQQLQHQQTVDSVASATPTTSGRHHAFENLQHSFRSLQVQYSSGVTEEIKQLQVMITAQKGVVLDRQSVARDTQAYSKELYAWGQKEKEDIKDVTDRLAWVNYTHGGLEANLSSALEAARAPLKGVRAAEIALHPKRNIRKGLHSQIQQIKAESKSPQAADRIAEVQIKLQKLEAEDAAPERDLEIEKRKALNDMEGKKWAAIREYAEKLLLLCQASDRILDELPSLPPNPQRPYEGGEKTGHTRATLQHALDNFKPGNILLEAPPSQLRKHDTQSFGVTHAHELSSIASGTTSAAPYPSTPPVGQQSPPSSYTQAAVPPSSYQAAVPPSSYQAAVPHLAAHATGSSPVPIPVGSPPSGHPINAGALNHTPAVIPGVSPVTSPEPVPAVASPAAAPVPDVPPTVAETGVPVLASGHGGPGPASGSLAGGHVTDYASPPPAAAPAAAPAPAAYETAEEEKKRLEREERERILRGSRHGRDPPVHNNQGTDSFPDASQSKDEEAGGPPPYQPY